MIMFNYPRLGEKFVKLRFDVFDVQPNRRS